MSLSKGRLTIRRYFYASSHTDPSHTWDEFDEELRVLFGKIDPERSGFVTPDELVRCLNILGYPINGEVIDIELKAVHQNSTHALQFPEFKKFMNPKMKSCIFRVDHMMDEIKKKMEKVHPTDGKRFDFNQFSFGMKTINKDFTNQEISTMFFTLDPQRRGYVYIDEFLQLIHSADTTHEENQVITNALFRIKKNHIMLLSDIIDVFNKLPQNFCCSFTRVNFIKLENLPSESIVPKLLPNTLGYIDTYPDYTDPKTGISYPLKPLTSPFVRMVTLKLATGVPIPEPGKLDKSHEIAGREIRCSFFDRKLHKFIGGTVIIKAIWDKDYEDRWIFESEEPSLLLRSQSTENLCVIFDFVIFIAHKGIEMQISCGWASFDLENMSKNTEVRIPLMGGSPIVTSKILTSDVRTSRGTFFGKLGKFFSGDIKSELTINIQCQDRFPRELIPAIDLLPKTILIQQNSIAFVRAFRCYLGKNVFDFGSLNKNLSTDIVVKTMIRCTNIGSVFEQLSKLWVSTAEPMLKVQGQTTPDYEQMIEKFRRTMNILYPLFDADQFKFNKTDPTLEHYEKSTIYQERQHLLAIKLNEVAQMLVGSMMHKGEDGLKYSRPFSVDELINDDFESINGSV